MINIFNTQSFPTEVMVIEKNYINRLCFLPAGNGEDSRSENKKTVGCYQQT